MTRTRRPALRPRLLAFALAAAFMVGPFLLPHSAFSQSKPRISATAVSVGVNLTGTPLTGVCPYNINLQWSATNAATCSKSGAWSGTAAASGSQVLSVNGGAATYTLTCSASSDSRQLNWTNPTTNTDGSAVNLGSNRVYHSSDPNLINSQNPAISLTPATTGYMLTGLPAGVRYVAVSAVSNLSIESALSATAQTTIVMPTGTDTVNATCTPPPQPKPPVAVTISSTVWDTKGSVGGGSIKVGTNVGYIGLGEVCLGAKPAVVQLDSVGNPVEYWQADKNLVTLRIGVKPRPGILVGVCQLQQS